MKLLFFTPHMALWVHTVPETYLARALAEHGYEISYLACGGMHTYCASMTARRVVPGNTHEKKTGRICSDCKAAASAIASVHHFPVDFMARYLRGDDKETLDAIAVDAVEKKSIDTVYLGVNVGRIALYEFTLFHKKLSTNLTPHQWDEYRIYLFNALCSLQAFARYLEKGHPDAILTFSPQYSNINSCMQYAIRQGIRVLFMESGHNLGHRLGTMMVWDWDVHRLVVPARTYWNGSEANPVTEQTAAKVLDYFRQLFKGLHFGVFSSAYTGASEINIRQRWNIEAQQKILLMTLSSYDEVYAGLLIDALPSEKVFGNVFRVQAEWVRATIDWVAARPNLFLIIRLHPRDFPNKRDNVRSEQSFMFEELLSNVPDNVHVNRPQENISLYELFEDVDVLLTGWSITALEALTLGIPAVTYDARMPFYPSDITYSGHSEEEYYANIEGALQDGWRLENVINGFRWLAYSFVTNTVVVSERFGQFETGDQTYLMRLWSRIRNRLRWFAYRQDLREWHDALAEVPIISAMLEGKYDAIPPARQAIEGQRADFDDREIVLHALKELYHMLYANSKLPLSKPGLSLNIRTRLARESQL